MRLALAVVALVVAVGPGLAHAPRCMAMVNLRTVDRTGHTTTKSGETIGPVVRLE